MDFCEIMTDIIDTLPEKLCKGHFSNGRGQFCAMGWVYESVSALNLDDSYTEFYSKFDVGVGLSRTNRITQDNDSAKTYKERRERAVKNLTAIRDAVCGTPS